MKSGPSYGSADCANALPRPNGVKAVSPATPSSLRNSLRSKLFMALLLVDVLLVTQQRGEDGDPGANRLVVVVRDVGTGREVERAVAAAPTQIAGLALGDAQRVHVAEQVEGEVDGRIVVG